MIRSMTGLGAASGESATLRAAVTVRSLNHRFLDVVVHMPRPLAVLEPDVKRQVQSRVERGRVEVVVQAAVQDEQAESVVASEAVVAGLVRTLRALKAAHGLAGEVQVSDVARFPRALEVLEAPLPMGEERRRELLDVVDRALDALADMRQAEGAHLAADLATRLAGIETAADRIAQLSESGKARRREQLLEKVRELGAELGLDDARFYQEVVKLADKQEISEELQRLRSHVALARDLVRRPGAAGKRLDFLAQELMREANTMGSKAASAPLVQEVVGLKSEIEKLREQVQNVE